MTTPCSDLHFKIAFFEHVNRLLYFLELYLHLQGILEIYPHVIKVVEFEKLVGRLYAAV